MATLPTRTIEKQQRKKHTMNPYEIDVIIPVFNGEKYLAETLVSVQKQTLLPARIIVVNDGSTDKTAEIIASFSQSDRRIIPLHLPQNRGPSAARNAGIETSSAPFVAFLDADDIWLPEKLETQVEVFQQVGPETGFVHSSYFVIDNTTENQIPGVNVMPPTRRGDIFLPLLLRGIFLSGSASSVLVRRAVLDQAGPFDEGLFYGQDWDMWIRLARISHVDFTSKAVVGIRAHDQSGSRRAWRERSIEFFQQHLLIYSKWEKEIANNRKLARFLRRWAADAALTVMLYRRSPAEGLALYQNLATHKSPFVQKLFHNVAHFWLEICRYAFSILWGRVKRNAGFKR